MYTWWIKGHDQVLVKLNRDSPERAFLYPNISIDCASKTLKKALICALEVTKHGVGILEPEAQDFRRKWLNPLRSCDQAQMIKHLNGRNPGHRALNAYSHMHVPKVLPRRFRGEPQVKLPGFYSSGDLALWGRLNAQYKVIEGKPRIPL